MTAPLVQLAATAPRTNGHRRPVQVAIPRSEIVGLLMDLESDLFEVAALGDACMRAAAMYGEPEIAGHLARQRMYLSRVRKQVRKAAGQYDGVEGGAE